MPSSSTKQSTGMSGSGDGTSVTKRLQAELTQLMMSGDNSVSAFPEGDNLFAWIGSITGSPGTVYEGLSFKLSLKFPSALWESQEEFKKTLLRKYEEDKK